MIARERSLVFLIALTFLCGGVIGGGPTSPGLSMFVELLACLLAAIGLAGIFGGHFPRPAGPALLLLAITSLVPILQLIPLPASYWQSMPGHQIPSAISDIAGLGHIARPMSLTPEQTSLGALCLIVPGAIFVATIQLHARSRDYIMVTVVLFALVSAILGMFQVAAGGGLDLGIYRQVHDGNAIGFFANRNHEATLLLIALPFSAHVIRLRHWPRHVHNYALIGAIVFFSLAVVSTTSRAGFSLLPVALGGTLVVWIGDLRDRRIWLAGTGLVALAVLSYAILRLTPVGSFVIHRFSDTGDDSRFLIWKGSWAALKQFWPLGSGFGSFVPVYGMFEDLDTLTNAWVNHAHNDYMEIVLETGAAGAILIGAYFILAAIAISSRVPSPLRGQRYAAVSALLLILMHSLADYPLRTFALLATFAFANGLLFPSRDAYRMRRSGSYPAFPAPNFAADVVRE